jgi:hypothetical protein
MFAPSGALRIHPSLVSDSSTLATVSNQLPVPDTVRGPNSDLGPVLNSSLHASLGLKVDISFIATVNKYLLGTYHVLNTKI